MAKYMLLPVSSFVYDMTGLLYPFKQPFPFEDFLKEKKAKKIFWKDLPIKYRTKIWHQKQVLFFSMKKTIVEKLKTSFPYGLTISPRSLKKKEA